MADEQETSNQTVEEVATPDTEVEVEWGAAALEYIQSKEPDEAVEEPGQEEIVEEVQEAAPEEPEAEAPETASRGARRQLAKERKLRSEREAFSTERDEWRAEQEEGRAAIVAYEKSKASAINDPVAFMRELGLSDDDRMNLARQIYYESMPENATPQVHQEMAAIKNERRMAKLERERAEDLEAAKPAPPVQQTAEYQAYESEYRDGLSQFAISSSAEEYPLVHGHIQSNFKGVVQELFNAALQNPNKQSGTDLTPQECMATLEAALKAANPATTPTPDVQTEEQPTQNRKATLRNKNTATMPNDKHDDELSSEEFKKRCQERAQAKMLESGLIR
jgi:hypothetical protein